MVLGRSDEYFSERVLQASLLTRGIWVPKTYRWVSVAPDFFTRFWAKLCDDISPHAIYIF